MYLNHQKRFYHPGYLNQTMKIALPLPPKNLMCNYEAPVVGNAIQKLQLQSNIGYNTNDIISKMDMAKQFYDTNHIEFVPTSHQTPVIIALNSCRNLNKETVDAAMRNLNKNSFIDSNGLLNTEKYSASDILASVEGLNSSVLNNAMRGIISNYADSIYIANDYLLVPGNDIDYIFVANYPSGAEMRDVERARIVANGLLRGQMPIILDSNINFEGEANIKFLPLKIQCQNKQYQAALTYDSSRSESGAVKQINEYLERLGVASIFEIKLYPRKGIEEILYHQDCALNFYVDRNNVQCLDFGENDIEMYDVDDIFAEYTKNGCVAMIKDGLDADSTQIIFNLFDDVIEIDQNDDLLGANMIMSEFGCVGSSLLNESVKEKIRGKNKFLEYEHPSVGGGGAHKCCSNITTNAGSEVSIEEWIQFVSHYDMDVSRNFIEAVGLEMQRLTDQINDRK